MSRVNVEIIHEVFDMVRLNINSGGKKKRVLTHLIVFVHPYVFSLVNYTFFKPNLLASLGFIVWLR